MSDQNLFALFEEDQTVAEIKNIKLNLFMLIISAIRDRGMTQQQVSNVTGITQPRVSNLMKGYLHKFSVEKLLSVALKLGAKPNNFVNAGATSYTVELAF